MNNSPTKENKERRHTIRKVLNKYPSMYQPKGDLLGTPRMFWQVIKQNGKFVLDARSGVSRKTRILDLEMGNE